MPITQSVKKRVRQDEKRRKYNIHYKTKMRSVVKKVLQADNKKDADPLYRKAVSIIDKIQSKGVIHKNKASRQKSKITKHFNTLS